MQSILKTNSFSPLSVSPQSQAMGEAFIELFRRSQKRSFKAIKTLRELFPDIVSSKGNMGLVPTELTKDSRKVETGSVFFAVDGSKVDGHAFIPEAITRGAIAIVSEKPLSSDYPITTIQVPSIRHAISDAARRFWGIPDKKLTLVGITGSKGKTTTAYFTRHILKNDDKDCGMLSSIENDLGIRSLPSFNTTAEIIDNASYMAQMVESGCTHAIMEISSRGIEQGRIIGLGLEVAVFTNLSADNLTNPKDIENYYQTKAKIFKGELGPKPKIAVINLDDPYGQRLYGEINEKVETITYGKLAACDMQIERSNPANSGTEFVLKLGNRRYNGYLPVIGEHNLVNAIGALAIAYALGISVKDSVACLNNFKGVPGRLEKINSGQAFEVIVDYAHTPIALEKTLGELRKIYKGRIITVFGCGGAVISKPANLATLRAKMTQTVLSLSDNVFATADNPRNEKLENIFEAMRKGILENINKIEFISCRREAITEALKYAQPGDCVLIAGKGHETYQEFSDSIIPFDDRKVAKEILKELGFSSCSLTK